jgi:type IV pilus assembly protein PilW
VTTPRHGPRGFTLIELTVSLVLAAILVAASVAILGQQQRALQRTGADRAMQENVRAALEEIGAGLRRAGFGIPPALAFDFSRMPPCDLEPAVACRDRIDGPDQVAFYARDPLFKATVASAPAESVLVIEGGVQRPLRRGQVLQVMCAGAAATAYVTVDRAVAASWTPPAPPPATTSIPLQAGTGAFPRENAALTSGCFATAVAGLRVYRVDRFRYYVARFPDREGGAPAGRPYLMLDRGLEDDDGTSRAEPVAPDVEDLQVEYLFVAPATGATRVVGATAGVRLADLPEGIDLAAAAPALDAPSADPARATNHPANLRAVRLSIVARSPVPDPANAAKPLVQLVSSRGAALPAAGNRPVVQGDDGFLRLRVETTETTRNLDSRGPFYDE